MNSIFILGMVQSLFFSFLIGTGKRPIKPSQIILITWLLSIFCILFFYFVSFSGEIVLFDLLLIFGVLNFTHGPLFYLYIKSITQEVFKVSTRHFLHIIPFLVVVAPIFYYQYWTENTVTISNGYLIFKDGITNFLKEILFATKIVNFVYFLGCFYVMYNYERKRSDFFSDIELVKFSWLKRFIIGVITCYFIMYFVSPNVFGLYSMSDFQIASLTTIVFVFLIFYTGFINNKQQAQLEMFWTLSNPLTPNSQAKVAVDSGNGTRYERSGLSSIKISELTAKILQHVDEEKPYLNPDINLHDLASQLEISTNHLSQIINGGLKKNFFTFINEYRVREFKDKVLMQQHEQYTLIGLALDCGFGSKSAFYNIFKRITGVTPADYIKEIEKAKEAA